MVKAKFRVSSLLKTTALLDAYFLNCLIWENHAQAYIKKLSAGLQGFTIPIPIVKLSPGQLHFF
jgi:hypothetical protein